MDIKFLLHSRKLLVLKVGLVLKLSLHSFEVYFTRDLDGVFTDFSETMALFDVHSELGLKFLNLGQLCAHLKVGDVIIFCYKLIFKLLHLSLQVNDQ